jgi:hypothetical protein
MIIRLLFYDNIAPVSYEPRTNQFGPPRIDEQHHLLAQAVRLIEGQAFMIWVTNELCRNVNVDFLSDLVGAVLT